MGWGLASNTEQVPVCGTPPPQKKACCWVLEKGISISEY